MGEQKRSFVWTPDKDELTETTMVAGKEYPTWIVERAQELAERTHGPFERALEIVEKFVEAERNTTSVGSESVMKAPSLFFTKESKR